MMHQSENWRKVDRDHHLGAQVDYREIYEQGGSRIISTAEGCYVSDEFGNRFLDGMAGLWCVNIGYGREQMAEAAAQQVRDLSFYHSFFKTAPLPTVKLAQRLARLLGGDLQHVFFANSGSEANDSFFRMARRYWVAKGQPEKRHFIALDNAYHGSTVASASLGGIKKMHEGGLPIEGCHHIKRPYLFAATKNDRRTPDLYGYKMAQKLQLEIDRLGAENVAGFIAEPIQGAGGVNIPPKSWWMEIEKICRRNDILLAVDEVICGFGRLGRWFGFQYFGIEPDFVTMAKGLSSGYVPIAALGVHRKVVDALRDIGGVFPHGFTYSGHPLSCAMALTNIEIIEKERLVERVAKNQHFFSDQLSRLNDHPLVGEVRSLGFLGAVELVSNAETNGKFPAHELVGQVCCENIRDEGAWVRPLGQDILAVCPPLIISDDQIRALVSKMERGLDRFLAHVGNG